jgi:signal transduction histidine kinase
VIERLTVRFILLFVAVLAALDAVAYWLYARMYAALLGPALTTPEGAGGLHRALVIVTETIVAADIPLLILVGLVSYWLAKTAVAPLLEARARERRFAADAAHELRSPLATIATVAQAAREGAPPASSSAFETIARSALDASALVGDLLTLARDPRPSLLTREPVDLAAIAIECRDDLVEIARKRGIPLEIDARSAIVDGDARRLKELLRNLADNAVKHARTSVTIATRRLDGSSAQMIVRNDGDPIDPQLHERIFERFYRADTDGDGSGLGLAIVRWIAQAHDGKVTVRCDETGTTFALTLPTVR